MNRTVSGALCAVALAGFASTAAAVPIYFNFTGSFTNAQGSLAGLAGTAVSGGFTLETDRLTRTERPLENSVSFTDHSGSAGHGFLNSGTSIPVFPAYPHNNAAGVLFNDSQCHDFTPCDAVSQDMFTLAAGSTDVPLEVTRSPGFVGTYHSSTLGINVLFGIGNDAFDWTTVTADAVASLPLGFVSGYYSDVQLFCPNGGGSCSPQETTSFATFSINSVTRGVETRSVPEPGTLGLLGAGLLAAFVTRRRVRGPQRA